MDGVVFDFDGVIADSMPKHAQAYREVLAPLGVDVTDAAVFAREGARSETIIRDLCAHAGVDPGDVAALADAKQRAFKRLGEVHLYPGAADMLAKVQDMVPMGLVTGTRRSNLNRLIPDLLPRFAAVMAQEDYTRDKPDPEPYANAAKAMAIPAARLTCVENAVRGIQSAQAAGYGRVIAIATTMPAHALAEADVVVANHADLAAALGVAL